MLTACAHAGPPAASAPDPIIERHEATRLVCPPDLRRPLPAAPPPAAGAVIRHNDAGAAYLDAKIARGEAAEAIVQDARAVCDRAGAQ
ncbi:hypothetical protein [Caulobacter segnis]|uniref:hypothetical protein n=1 Tax=Caulobacter segnis TaxID=88688 RepID=UPI0026BA50CE|nr:hypothetical protein [Caulobacter segnis]